MKCYLVETISSDEALLVHLQNIGPILPDLFSVAPIVEWEIYGHFSQQEAETVKAIAAGSNIILVRSEYVSGFTRELANSQI